MGTGRITPLVYELPRGAIYLVVCVSVCARAEHAQHTHRYSFSYRSVSRVR